MVVGKGERDMMKQTVGRAPSQGKQLMKAMVWGVIWTIGASLAAALLVDREIIPMEKIGYGSMVILLVCGFLLAKKGGVGSGKEKLVGAAVATGLYYLCLLLVNWLFFGGKFRGFGVTLIVLLIGAFLGTLSPRKGRGGGTYRRYKIPKT